MQTVGTCWIRVFINILLPSWTSWQVPVQPVQTNFCLQILQGFLRPSPLDYPYTIRKTVLRSIWLIPAVKPLFLPRVEEEMIPILYAAAFCIAKGDQCISFTLHLFTRPNNPDSFNLYPWDIPARSPITALWTSFCTFVCAMQRSGHKMQGGVLPVMRRGEVWLCVLLIQPWVTSAVFILRLLMKILNKRNRVDPHKLTTNTNDAVCLTDCRAWSKLKHDPCHLSPHNFTCTVLP